MIPACGILRGASPAVSSPGSYGPEPEHWEVRAWFRTGEVDERGCPEWTVERCPASGEAAARSVAEGYVRARAVRVHLIPPRERLTPSEVHEAAVLAEIRAAWPEREVGA